MIQRLLLILIVLWQAPLATAEQALASSVLAKELLFLTWADYIDPEVVQAFERKFDVKVRQVHFESDDARDDLLVENDGHGYDVVIISTGTFATYQKRGWLAPLGENEISNLVYIDKRWATALPEAVGYGVPYFWGTTGIAYRADLVPEKITGWKQLFEPQEALRGKIVMIKNARNVIGMALKALGYSLNSTDPQELLQAERLLLSQKPYVSSYSYISLGRESELVSGRILAAMVYNGDALTLREHNANIVYVAPEEGSNIWIDYLAVLQSSPRKQLAMNFVNFLHEPENAARLARFLHYATPNKAAEKLLPAELLQNPVIYPNDTLLEKSEFSRELPPRIHKQRNNIFARLLQ